METRYSPPPEIEKLEYTTQNQSIHPGDISRSFLEDLLPKSFSTTLSLIHTTRHAFDYTMRDIKSTDRIKMDQKYKELTDPAEERKREFADYLLRMLDAYKQLEIMLARNIGDSEKSEEFMKWVFRSLSELA